MVDGTKAKEGIIVDNNVLKWWILDIPFPPLDYTKLKWLSLIISVKSHCGCKDDKGCPQGRTCRDGKCLGMKNQIC